MINLLIGHEWVERLGWTLVHFLWQGALIAALYAIACRSRSPQIRYVLACVALAAMVIAPVITFALAETPESAQVKPFVGTIPVSSTGAAVLQSSPGSPFIFTSNQWHNSLMPWLVLAWFAGAIIFSIRLTGGWIVAARMKSKRTHPAPAPWQETLNQLKTRIRISHPVRLLVSAIVQVPTVVGWLRPVILVPVGALAGLAPEHIQALLAHELAHIRRHDYLLNLLQSVVEALLFYHPAVWWLSSQIRHERELCCDDIAVAISGDALNYARALAGLESQRPARFTPALAANGGSLPDRVGRLLGISPAARPVSGPAAIAAAALILVTAIAIFAQPAAPRPEFEVASIRQSPPYTPGVSTSVSMKGGPGTSDPGRVTFENFPLPSLISEAYDLRTYQLAGPDWLLNSYGPLSPKFNIAAKIPDGTTKEQFHQMLQNLLAERFGLVIHHETKELPIYNLVVPKNGPKLKPSPDTPQSPDDVGHGASAKVTMGSDGFPVLPPGTTMAWVNGRARMRGTRKTMEQFVVDLAAQSNRPVRDMTGLKGEYDFEMFWLPDSVAEADINLGPTLTQAVQEQLGLRLESTKGPVDILVVDRVEKTPTGN